MEQSSSALSPFQFCPPSIFAEIVKINHLRHKATDYSHARSTDLSHEAHEILRRVQAFSTQNWADSKPSSTLEWVLIGNSYQLAVALYCISALQSLSVLPRTPHLRVLSAAYGERLQNHLDLALQSPSTRALVLWPLVVLGVEAVHANAATRAFVRNHLVELSRAVGSYAPLTAKDVLETFWASGETGWDLCFPTSYAFTTQIAADTSGLLPNK
jgi:hypothetical protein